MQVKIIVEPSCAELERSVNAFLADLPEAPKSMQFDLKNWSAIVEYENVQKGICCECKFWDDGGDVESLVGICQKQDVPRRYGQKSCKDYVDRRE